MKTIEIGAGTTFNITIPLDKEISEYENVLIALYTDKNKSVKFSYVEKEGYNKLEAGSTTSELVGVLTSAQTDKMRGLLTMELAAQEIGTTENVGKSLPTYVKDSNGSIVELCENVL